MAKSYNPIFTWPTEKTGFFEGKPVGDKLLKDISGISQSEYGGWWPSFFPTSVGFLVTGNKDAYNVMTISCMVVCCAHPFMVGFPVFGGEESTRGNGPRYSLDLLRENPEFTLNVGYINDEMTKRVLICGSLSGRDGTDKFKKADFTPEPSLHVEPPRILECPLNLEAKIHSIQELGTHNWVIGKVEAVYADKTLASGEDQYVWRSMPELHTKG